MTRLPQRLRLSLQYGLSALCFALLSVPQSEAAPQLKEIHRSSQQLSAPIWYNKQVLFAEGISELRSYHFQQNKIYSQLPCAPETLATGPRNQLIIACKGQLFFINDRGQLTESYPRPKEEQGMFSQELPPLPLEKITAMVTDPQGGIYLAVTHQTQPRPNSGRIYYLSPQRKKFSLLLDGLAHPAGLALSPDNAKLYVSLQEAQQIVRYQLEKGELKNAQILINTQSYNAKPGSIALNSRGHIYTVLQGAGQLLVTNLEGKKLASLELGAPYITGFTYTETDRRLVVSTRAQNQGGVANLLELKL